MVTAANPAIVAILAGGTTDKAGNHDSVGKASLQRALISCGNP
jgi:hypothetical protein